MSVPSEPGPSPIVAAIVFTLARMLPRLPTCLSVSEERSPTLRPMITPRLTSACTVEVIVYVEVETKF